ncbi:TraX family protein [Cohnella sp. GCM10027633]|uniref:TraX family protein n=1 Tax=unclassified Cohnella TaxID=2636738 RepID=UPI00363E3FE1
MQIMAMITMLIDHIGLIFFPDNAVWRIIGRIALPIYAYCIVQGFLHTRSVNNYLRRLTVLAAISQVPYMLSFSTLNINVIATLAVCLAVIVAANRYPLWTIGFVAAGALALEALPFSYGYYALALVLMYRYLHRHYWVAAHFALNLFALWFDNGWWVQSFSIVPTVFLAYRETLFAEFKLGIAPPRWVWRSFYPAHLAALAVIAAVMNAG